MRGRTCGARWQVVVTVALLCGAWSGTARPVAAGPGDLDPTFGSGGKVLTVLGGGAAANALALQPDGKIVVAGGAYASGKYLSWSIKGHVTIKLTNSTGSPNVVLSGLFFN